jgi:hypothetical protein
MGRDGGSKKRPATKVQVSHRIAGLLNACYTAYLFTVTLRVVVTPSAMMLK